MSASDNLNPQQLKMFMTRKEIMSEFQPLPGDINYEDLANPNDPESWRSPETRERLWARKAEEAEWDYEPPLQDILHQTLHNPIRLVYPSPGQMTQVPTTDVSPNPRHASRGAGSATQPLDLHRDYTYGGQTVPLDKPTVANGHHRLAVAPDDMLMPVLHYSNRLQATIEGH